MNDDQLRRIEARVAAAHPDYWQTSRYVQPAGRVVSLADARRFDAQEAATIRGPGIVGTSECNIVFTVQGPGASPANMAFIAKARQDVPALLREVRRLQQAFEQHTKAVDAFLGELYAIMVDPLAEGTIPVSEIKKALLKSATETREKLAEHG